jgi:ribosomal protein L32
MAKRLTGVGKNKTTRSKKTAKRLAVKMTMLDAKEKKLGYRGIRK